MRTFLLLATLAPLAACSSTDTDDTEVAEITVLAHLTPCTGSEVLDCMIVDDGGGTENLYDTIEGFEYHWGSTYQLEVDIVTIRNPVPDQSSRQLHLREVIEVQPVAPNSEFRLALRGEIYPGGVPLLTPVGQGFAMPYGRQITCQDPAVCTAISDALRQPTAFDLVLRHPDDPTNEQVPLTAVSVIRAD